MERTFKKNLAALDSVFEFVDQFVGQHELDESTAYAVNFAIEELFTNMVKYSKSRQEMRIALKLDGRSLTIELTEYDVDEFDITKVGSVDTELSLDERKVGGLGLHLTRQIMDNIEYTHKGGNSIITLTKQLEN